MADGGMERVYAVEMRERKKKRKREVEQERKGSTEEVKNNIVCRLEICPRILH